MYKESVCRLDDQLIATIIVFLHFSRSRCTRILKVWRGKKNSFCNSFPTESSRSEFEDVCD